MIIKMPMPESEIKKQIVDAERDMEESAKKLLTTIMKNYIHCIEPFLALNSLLASVVQYENLKKESSSQQKQSR